MTQVRAFLGYSVGVTHHERLNQDFIPDPWDLDVDRVHAIERWDQAKERWYPNEISNFLPYKEPLVYAGLSYRFPEAFYQACKSQDQDYRKAIAACEAANKTKFLAGKLKAQNGVREGWHDMSVGVMTYAQKHRINTDPKFANFLKSTRHRYVYEWNNWNDNFWGVSIYTGEGKSMLGRILMILRDLVYWK